MNGDGMSEQNLRENPAGPPRINERNYNVESEYEYGSRAGIWRLFRLLKKYGIKYTRYAVAQAVEQQPEVVRRSVEEGHDVASHVEKGKDFIRRAITSLKSLSGYAPKGWYYGRKSPQSRVLVPQAYKEMGEELIWCSDTYADDVPYWLDLPYEKDLADPRGLLMVPYSHLKNAFDVLCEEGEEGMPKMMTIGLHWRMLSIDRSGRIGALRDFVDYIIKKDSVWVATRTEIAEAFKSNHPHSRGQIV
ncbi:hypothetical protein NLU13_1322 [Sarocladium strictum]|uniref:NodB homology domain-containing protein n=1 Tax=Sarocladium strictum TaxID=5046 RepID=A0AA39GQR1_SARSR|nr:hypothetical protein NLU13_1322 [Sarocladium strictum]